MKLGFSLTLNEQRRRDMSTALNFFLWLSRRSDINLHEYDAALKDAIALLGKLKQLPIGSKLTVTLGEFLMIYTSAQYMLKAMNGTAGFEYISDTLAGINNYDWFEKQKKYFVTISRFLIRECETKFEDLPEFARERMKMEEQLHPF